MANFEVYQIIRSINDLPPRDIKVFTLTNPLEVDLTRENGDIGLDIEIENSSGGAYTVTINNEDSFILAANSSKALSNIMLSRFLIEGGTLGQVIVHTISIKLLQRLNAVEIR